MGATPEPHPDVQDLLDQLGEFDVLPLAQYGPAEARALFQDLRPDVEGPSVGEVTDRTVPGYREGPDVPVRVYTPAGDPPWPTIGFFHGGGWVIGNLDTHDLVCRYVTNAVGAQVVSVDYRLAPEHPFPAALEDAYAVTEWIADDPAGLERTDQLAVMGDSAGGNLAAAVSLMARDLADGPALDRQVLVYPAVARGRDWPSMAEFADGYFLNETDMEWFRDAYLPSPIPAANPYANPLEARSHTDLPPASIVTAGFDPLRDQGIAYAETLAAAGVAVDHHHYDDMIHGFFSMLEGLADLEAAHDALEAVADDLEETWN